MHLHYPHPYISPSTSLLIRRDIRYSYQLPITDDDVCCLIWKRGRGECDASDDTDIGPTNDVGVCRLQDKVVVCLSCGFRLCFGRRVVTVSVCARLLTVTVVYSQVEPRRRVLFAPDRLIEKWTQANCNNTEHPAMRAPHIPTAPVRQDPDRLL